MGLNNVEKWRNGMTQWRESEEKVKKLALQMWFQVIEILKNIQVKWPKWWDVDLVIQDNIWNIWLLQVKSSLEWNRKATYGKKWIWVVDNIANLDEDTIKNLIYLAFQISIINLWVDWTNNFKSKYKEIIRI